LWCNNSGILTLSATTSFIYLFVDQYCWKQYDKVVISERLPNFG
jgi:hypothetical protein